MVRAQSFRVTPSTGAALQAALAMVTGKCLLELVALLAEKGAKVLELRIQTAACGGLHRDAACARLLQQLAH